MGNQIFPTGSITHGTSQSGIACPLPAATRHLGFACQASYAATAATTGVQVFIAVSLDGGATFTDYVSVGTVAPTASSGTAVSAYLFGNLDNYLVSDALLFKLTNLDGTNNATVTLTVRAE